MAEVLNLNTTVQEQGLSATWDLPTEDLYGLLWEVREGHNSLGTVRASEEWPTQLDRIWVWAQNNTHPVVAGFVTEGGHAYWWGQVNHHYTGTAPGSLSTSSQDTPVRIELEGVVAMAHGRRHTLLLRDDGSVWGYGMATKGELGNALTRNVPYDNPVQIIASDITQIAVSEQASYALHVNGGVRSWGEGAVRSGRGAATADTATPSELLISGVTLLVGSLHGGVAWAPNHATSPGLYCWGSHSADGDSSPTFGLPMQLAPSGSSGFGTPTESTIPDSDFITAGVGQIELFPGGGFILTSGGALYPWGNNSSGLLGLGDSSNGYHPFSMGQKLNGPFNWVSATDTHALAIRNGVLVPGGGGGTKTVVFGSSTAALSEDALPDHPLDGIFRIMGDGIPGGFQPTGMKVVGTARNHSYWVDDYAEGSAVSYGTDDNSLLGRSDPLLAPHIERVDGYKARTDLPTSLSVPTGLSAGTDYRVLVYLYDESGSTDSVTQDVTTLEGWLAPTVSLVPGDRQLQIDWIKEGEGVDPITGWWLNLSSYRNNRVDSVYHGPVTPTEVGGGYRYTVTGLTNGLYYTVLIRGTTDDPAVILPYGMAYDYPDTTPSAPTGVNAYAVGGAGVWLGWNAPETHPHAYQLLQYSARLSYTLPEGGGTGDVVVAMPSGTHENFQIPLSVFYDNGPLEAAFDANAMWTMAVRATNDEGTGPWSTNSSPLGPLQDYPAQPENFRVDASSVSFVLSWDTPLRNNYTGFRIRYRPFGESSWTSSGNLPAQQRTYTIGGVLPGTLYQVEIVSTNGSLESATVGLNVSLREINTATITFRGDGVDIVLPLPNSAELQIPGDMSPILTQSGFFLPTQAIDDMEAIWSIRWRGLALRYVGPLENLQTMGTLTMTDPLGFAPLGYIESVYYQGVPGSVDADTGEPLYEASAEFRVIRMQLPALLGKLPDGTHAPGAHFGIASTGNPPLSVGGDTSAPTTVVDGWFPTTGGAGNPWAGVTTPAGESWVRSQRATPTSSAGATGWLELDASTLPPESGTAYLGVTPIGASGIPVGDPEEGIDEALLTSAPGAYYGYWDVTDADLTIEGAGKCTIRHEVVNLDISPGYYLPLGAEITPLDLDGSHTLKYQQAFGVVTRYLEQLPRSATPTVGRDAEGQLHPGPGIYVRRDTRRLDGTLLERRYLPAEWRYNSNDLYPTTEAHNHRVHTLGVLATAVRNDLLGGTTYPYGGNLTSDMATLFGWLDRSGPPSLSSEQAGWTFGLAGPYERVLMGSGERDVAGWLVYALDRSLVVEFWRDNQLVFTRQLDLSSLIHGARLGDRFLVALGYDYRKGKVALGVSRRGANPHHVYRNWNAAPIKGHGYRHPTLYLGAVPVRHDNGALYSKSSWSWVCPVDRGFVHEHFLSPGNLARLMENLT
jgi:hypothetical protein